MKAMLRAKRLETGKAIIADVEEWVACEIVAKK
jgi:hypothetical protein